MDASRKLEEKWLTKPWLVDADRDKVARISVDAFSSQGFVTIHGRTSGQRFLEASKGFSAARDPVAGRHALDAISRVAALALRDALDDVPPEALAGGGLRVPIGILLPEGAEYAPLRVAADDGPCAPKEDDEEASHCLLCVEGERVRHTGAGAAPAGASLRLRLLLPEGVAVAVACRVGVGRLEARACATKRLVRRITALPPHFAAPLLEALDRVWHLEHGACRQGVPPDRWFAAVERLRRQARSAASAHILIDTTEALQDTFKAAMSAAPLSTSSSMALPPCAAPVTKGAAALLSFGPPLPCLLPPAGLAQALLPPPTASTTAAAWPLPSADSPAVTFPGIALLPGSEGGTLLLPPPGCGLPPLPQPTPLLLDGLAPLPLACSDAAVVGHAPMAAAAAAVGAPLSDPATAPKANSGIDFSQPLPLPPRDMLPQLALPLGDPLPAMAPLSSPPPPANQGCSQLAGFKRPLAWDGVVLLPSKRPPPPTPPSKQPPPSATGSAAAALQVPLPHLPLEMLTTSPSPASKSDREWAPEPVPLDRHWPDMLPRTPEYNKASI